MTNRPANTASLAAFKRRSAEFLERMRESHEPITLTVNGNPEMVVQTTEDYQRLVDEVETAQAIEGIRRGLASMRAGNGVEADDAFRQLESKYPHLRNHGSALACAEDACAAWPVEGDFRYTRPV